MSSPMITIALDPQKRQLIRELLLLILHCEGCQDYQCSLPNCSAVKAVLRHITTCTDDNRCSVRHCLSCRHIRSHWYQCFSSSTRCPVCSPFKEQRLRIVLMADLLLNRQLTDGIQALRGMGVEEGMK